MQPARPQLETQATSGAARLYWSRERMRAYQLERLRDTLAQAANAPFYAPRLRGVCLESVEDLARLPLTTKAEVRAASPSGLLAVEPTELFQYHESFGTTGAPASSWMTRSDFENYAAQINHAAVDFRPGDRVVVRFPYAISVPAHIVTQAAHDRGACVIPVSSRSAVSPYPRVIDLLRKLDATVLCCLPTEAIWLAEAARLKGLDSRKDFSSLRALAVAGELLTDARRERIADLWQARVFNLYGCTEAGNIAADCEAGSLHVSWDHFAVEVLDEATGRPVSEGERGIAVVTTLTRRAMPLLRYVLGDSIRLQAEHHCPCGRTAPLLQHYGRDLNLIRYAGRTFFTREIEEILLPAGAGAIGNFWLYEVRPQGVKVRVEAEYPDAALYRRLEAQIRSQLDLPLEIDPAPPGALLDRRRFQAVEPVAKPRTVGYIQDGAAPLTLDALMAAGE